MAKKKTQDEFIAECIALNGDLHLFDRVDYKTAHVKVWIGCKTEGHGYWPVAPHHYLQGSGCPKCAPAKIGDRKRSNTEEFLVKAKKMAGADNHLFDRVDYKDNRVKVWIGCKTEGHGYWAITPNNFLRGHGCPKCGGTKKKTQDGFIADCQALNGDLHLLDRVDYKNAKTHVEIGCRIHGYWKTTPTCYLRGHGCSKCGDIKVAGAMRKSEEEFIVDARRVHGDIHLFDLVDYKDDSTKVKIGCKTEGHGYWSVTPSNYLQGSGCPSCTEYGIKLAEPGRLYYLRVDAPEGVLYKIGISNHTVAKRYSKRDMEKIEIIDEITYEVGADAYAAEQLILRHFSTLRRDFDRDNRVLAKRGDTELLLDNVLGVGDLQRMINACREYDSALQLAS